MRTLFDDDVFRSHLVQLLQRGEDVVLLRELVGFAVVEDKAVDALDEVHEVFQGDVQPEVHRVGDDEPGFVHLVEDVVLERRGDVGEEDEGRLLVLLGKVRGELLEHAQLGGERAAVVHVDLVFAGPVEGLARLDLEARQVDAVLLVERDILLGEILADHAHEVDRGEEAGRDGGVAGRAAEEPGIFGRGGLDGVECGGADDEDAHADFRFWISDCRINRAGR